VRFIRDRYRWPFALAAGAMLVAVGALGFVTTRATSTLRGYDRPAVVSPDGARIALVRRAGGTGYLEVTPPHGKPRVVYSSTDGCCSNVVWASKAMLVFDDDYNAKTVDVMTGHVNRIAGFSRFVVSPGGRWVAGWADNGGHSPQAIGVVSITGTDCRVVPKPNGADDGDRRSRRTGSASRLSESLSKALAPAVG
jgi:hypothetical protein